MPPSTVDEGPRDFPAGESTAARVVGQCRDRIWSVATGRSSTPCASCRCRFTSNATRSGAVSSTVSWGHTAHSCEKNATSPRARYAPPRRCPRSRFPTTRVAAGEYYGGYIVLIVDIRIPSVGLDRTTIPSDGGCRRCSPVSEHVRDAEDGQRAIVVLIEGVVDLQPVSQSRRERLLT